jgi:hypothetical protein
VAFEPDIVLPYKSPLPGTHYLEGKEPRYKFSPFPETSCCDSKHTDSVVYKDCWIGHKVAFSSWEEQTQGNSSSDTLKTESQYSRSLPCFDEIFCGLALVALSDEQEVTLVSQKSLFLISMLSFSQNWMMMATTTLFFCWTKRVICALLYEK